MKKEITTDKNIRNQIQNFESDLKKVKGVFVGDSDICPLKHSFSDGIYVREIFIPAKTVIVGKIHKHEHPNFLMSGEVDVVTEEGAARLKGPCSMISPAGTKRALHAITDLVWVTVHANPTNTQDMEKLEKIVIADSYEEYERFKNKKLPFYKKLLKLIGK